MGINRVLERWKSEPTIAEQITYWQHYPQQPASLVSFPVDLNARLAHALRVSGISALYSHQREAWDYTTAGENVLITTGTASGKSLCYHLPVLQMLLADPNATAIYMFPTKALAQDQLAMVERLLDCLPPGAGESVRPAVYDGDTPVTRRSTIRGKSRLIFTNPDMLHHGVLPMHTGWAHFLRALRYVVVDEVHTYRGVFGSHVANLLRRLERVARFYGAFPQYVMTSATISNAAGFGERLIDRPVKVVERDGAPHGAKDFLLYNPPLVDPDLGLRRSASHEAVRLAGDLMAEQVQTIVFGKARKTIEHVYRFMQESDGIDADQVRAYRSGYLPTERRAIERDVRTGTARLVVSTNALELGIDIGGLDAALMIGYPGTVASLRQQSGRAGRTNGRSVSVLVASASPMDQFLMRHPEYVFDRSPERALINPENPLILLAHLRCAAFELPFRPNEGFGSLPDETVHEYLDFLSQAGDVRQAPEKTVWISQDRPSNEVSLRSSSPGRVVLQLAAPEHNQRTIGEIDPASAHWMVHPGAIYLHAGVTYEVQSLDLENGRALVNPTGADYFTEPKVETTVELLDLKRVTDVAGGSKSFGDIRVTTQVTGFKRVRWNTYENLGEEELTLPPQELVTTGYWMTLSDLLVDQLREAGMWSNDPNQYGPNWKIQRNLARKRDGFRCQVCGAPEDGKEHHVHHKIPFRTFHNYLDANAINNLVTVCPSCHRRIETSVRVRNSLSGLSYSLANLAPLFLMCDPADLGASWDAQAPYAGGKPTALFYDLVPAGIGLAESLFDLHSQVIQQAHSLVNSCECNDGCPSCVGPGGENGLSAKAETLEILKAFAGFA